MMTGYFLLTMIEWRRYSKLTVKMNGNGPNHERLKITKRGNDREGENMSSEIVRLCYREFNSCCGRRTASPVASRSTIR